MTAYDNPVLMFAAFAALAAAFFLFLKYYKQISISVGLFAGGGLAVFGVLYILALIAGEIYQRHVAAQCLTAHERFARASVAPNDYWGKQLREEAAEEAKKCAQLAAKKEAAQEK